MASQIFSKNLGESRFFKCYSDKGSALVEPRVNKKEGERITLYEPADKFMKILYKSRLLIFIKNRIKSLVGYLSFGRLKLLFF